MFRNTLSGLSKREKEVFDMVCMHLNGCMRRMGLRHLDGEEDQILIDLWMDTFPYKLDEHGNYVMRTVREKVWETVDGKYTQVVKEKQVRELDFTKSLVESTSVGIYKWRAEQLLINKCKYLFGDKRVRATERDEATGKMKPITVIVVDAWGNQRKKAKWEEAIDVSRVGKRDLSIKVNESDLAREGEDPITIEDVAGCVEGGYDEVLLLGAISEVCDETEMKVVRKFMDGDSANRIYKDFEAEGVKFSARQMNNLKQKVAQVLRPQTV